MFLGQPKRKNALPIFHRLNLTNPFSERAASWPYTTTTEDDGEFVMILQAYYTMKNIAARLEWQKNESLLPKFLPYNLS